MSSSTRLNLITSNSRLGKASLTFESVVCSQLELQRRAASFSHRRATTCRRASQYRFSLSPNHQTKLIKPASTSQLEAQADFSSQFLQIRPLSSTRSSTTSMFLSPMSSTTQRPSFTSILSWDLSNKSQRRSRKDGSRWSLEYPKSTPIYWSLRTRLIEEYNESESLLEFAKKTVLVLMKTKEATIFLCIILIFPVIMIGVGVSHLDNCPRQTNLPIYLFVGGTVWTTKLLQNIWDKYRLEQKCRADEEPSSDQNDGHVFIDGLMTIFLIIWFFMGQYWLTTIDYPPYFEQLLENPDIWCHKTVVYCSFASIIVTYLTVIFFVTIILFFVFFTRHTVIKRGFDPVIRMIH